MLSAVLARVLAPGRLGLDPRASPSGPTVAALFHRLFALVSLAAWLSLAVQIRVLVGARGLAPLDAFLAAVRAQLGGVPVLGYPSLLRWPALVGDGVLVAGCGLGAALAVAALFGVRPRLMAALSTVLYLSYVAACREFLGFQWDNLLLEVGLVATFLPVDRPAPLLHVLLRLVAFKLYFESGLAKWQSPIGDWRDGSAMTHYYETAPLPTALARWAHQLPGWWHRLETWATLVLELVLPFAILGPRRARRVAFAGFGAFQLVDLATANYGFFCYLSLALHVSFLDESDVRRLSARLRRRLPWRVRRWRGPWRAPPTGASLPARRRAGRLASRALVAGWLAISLVEGAAQFGRRTAWLISLEPVRAIYGPLRLVNTYHLFASVTFDRIEPQVETEGDGVWTEQHLRHKPGDPARAPGFVAPHQPRVDFLLWFYGLRYEGREPAYVATLVDRVCRDPAAVQPLFRTPLPAAPSAVRLSFWRYELLAPGAGPDFWDRTRVEVTRPVPCASAYGK